MKHREKRVVVSVDMDAKNSHRFADGTTIRLERGFDNFNQREVQPVNAVVISAENIPKDAEILLSHKAVHDVNKIVGYKKLSGAEQASSVKYYSMPEDDCYAYRDAEGVLQPLRGYAFAMRVFEPYKGKLVGLPPKLLKNVLYITTGKLSGSVVHTLMASDYEVVYQDTNGREGRLIRIRHSDDEEMEREEVVAVNHDMTEAVNSGKLWVGLTSTDAKNISLWQMKQNA